MMRRALIVVAMAVFPGALPAQEDLRFEQYFLDRTMRIDYFQTGDAEEEHLALDQIHEEGAWAGNPHRLVDRSGAGMYFMKVYDVATNRLIYSRGFATIFGEYRTTNDAKNGLARTYHQSARVPFPKSPVIFVIEGRNEHHLLAPVFTARIDPANVNIIREKPDRRVRVRDIAVAGLPPHQVDIALVAEGYSAEEEGKFWQDAERFAGVMFRHEPFGSQRAKISIRAVFLASSESGVDQPRQGIFRNSAVDAAFNALDLERYLLIDDNKALRDIAGAVPYDILAVLANSTRYGGGGIYNDYCISTVDNARSEQVFMHEFGHAFGNLADEYFGTTVSYNEFYPPGLEPHEPNITALLDPQSVKWKHLLTPGIPIPTPWGQEEIEALQVQSRALAEELRVAVVRIEEQGGAQEEIRQLRDEYRGRTRKLNAEVREIRQHYQDLYRGKIGVFEGAGYSAKGLYRSEIHIGMLHKGSYGPVSEEALTRMIEYLTGQS